MKVDDDSNPILPINDIDIVNSTQGLIKYVFTITLVSIISVNDPLKSINTMFVRYM